MEKSISDIDYDRLYKIIRRKNGSGKVLFLDGDEKVLIVKSTGLDYWTLPGGTSEMNESPLRTAIREIKEEIGLICAPVRLLAVNYTQKKGNDSISFLFYGGVLSENEKDGIRLQQDELDEYRFLAQEEALQMLEGRSAWVASGLRALKENTVLYLENGNEAL
jgi:8-oxo-dGTP diphosphatase